MSMPTKLGLVFLGLTFGGTTLLGISAAQYLTTVSARSHVQQVADDAAISGVLALASNKDRGIAMAQYEAAIAASHIITSRIDGAWSSVTPRDDMTLSVRISTSQQAGILGLGGAVEVVGTARYLPPGQRQEALADRLNWKTQYAQSRQ
jgi:hypothetical protein